MWFLESMLMDVFLAEALFLFYLIRDLLEMAII